MQDNTLETGGASGWSQGATSGAETRKWGNLESKTGNSFLRSTADVRTYNPFFERKYIVKDASVLPNLPSSPLLVRTSPPSGKPVNADNAAKKEIPPLRQRSQLVSGIPRAPGLSTLPPLLSTVPPNFLSPRAVHALEQLSNERVAASRETSLELVEWTGADFSQEREEGSSRLSSACMEEAITLFLDEERLLEDLDKVKPVNSPLTSEYDGLLLSHSSHSKSTLRSKELQSGSTGNADTSPSPELQCDTATHGLQVGSGESRKSPLTNGGSKSRAGPASALSVGAYHSVSLTKVQQTEDRRHVVLTTLEWDRFKRVVTNLLSTNLNLRSKVRATQQHLRHLGYSGSLEQTVARLKNEELQMRRNLATREAHFAEAYSLRAKLEQCQQSLACFRQPLVTSKELIHSLQSLQTVLGNAIRRTRDTRISTLESPEDSRTSTDSDPDEDLLSPRNWRCEGGCIKVHREIRVAANRCFIVSIHIRLPGRRLLSGDVCNYPGTRPSELAASTDVSPSEAARTASAQEVDGNQSAAEGNNKRIDVCPYPAPTGDVGTTVGTYGKIGHNGFAPSEAKTLRDLHCAFLAREIEEDIKDQSAEVLVVSYEADTASVNIQTLELREFPAQPAPSFLEGLVRHVCSNLHLDREGSGRAESPSRRKEKSAASPRISRGECIGMSHHAALKYRKPRTKYRINGARALTRQDEADESLLDDTVESLVYSGYHQVTDDTSGPSHFYVSLYYRRAKRHVIARLFSPRSAELFVVWVDLFYASNQYERFLEANATHVPISRAEKSPNKSKTEVKMTSGLLRFIGSRLRLTSRRKVVFATDDVPREDEVTLDPRGDAEADHVAPGRPTARGQQLGQGTAQAEPCTEDADAQVEACIRQRLLERLASSGSASYKNNQGTLNLRQAHLLERTGPEAGARGQPCFVLISSSIPLALPRSISFVVYEPTTGWCADSSFRLTDGLEVLQRRQRTFLEKLRVDQATLSKLQDAIRGGEVTSARASKLDVRGFSHENHSLAEIIKMETPEFDVSGTDGTRVAPYQYNIDSPPSDTADVGLAALGPAASGPPSPLAAQNSSSCQTETGCNSPEKSVQRGESARLQETKVPTLTKKEWIALLGEIYRDLIVTSDSLSLPGISLCSTTVCS